MSKEKLDKYDLFYQEITQRDYLDGIDQSIQDDHVPSDSESIGLSKDQVHKIADDQLQAIKASPAPVAEDANSLFAEQITNS